MKPKAPQPPVLTSSSGLPSSPGKDEKSSNSDADSRETIQQQQQVSEECISSSSSCQVSSDLTPLKSSGPDGQQKRRAPKPLAAIEGKSACKFPPSDGAVSARVEHTTLTVGDSNHDGKLKHEVEVTPTRSTCVTTGYSGLTNGAFTPAKTSPAPADTSHVSIVTIDDNGKDVTIQTASCNSHEQDSPSRGDTSSGQSLKPANKCAATSSSVVYSSSSLLTDSAAESATVRTKLGNKSLSEVSEDFVVVRTNQHAKEVIIVSSEAASKPSSPSSFNVNCRLHSTTYSTDTHPSSSSSSCKLITDAVEDTISIRTESSADDAYPNCSDSLEKNRIKVNLNSNHSPVHRLSAVATAPREVTGGRPSRSTSPGANEAKNGLAEGSDGPVSPGVLLRKRKDQISSNAPVAASSTGQRLISGRSTVSHAQKKTLTRTRKFVIDGVVVTTTTTKIIHGDEDKPSEDHVLRKQELRELKMLQKQENKQFQDLAVKAQAARDQYEKKCESEMANLLRNHENELEALNRQQKTLVEKAEQQQEVDLKFASKKIRQEQEREIKLFRESLKNEMKLMKQEIELLPKDKRKDAFKLKKEQLDAELSEKDRRFVEIRNSEHDATIRQLSDSHREKIAMLERQFMEQRHKLLRDSEAANWGAEKKHMEERQFLAKRQLQDIFCLQRLQLLTRHEKVNVYSCLSICLDT